MKRISTAIIITALCTQLYRICGDNNPLAWDIYCCSLMFKNAVWLWILFSFISYNKLIIKSAVFVVFVYELSEVLLYFTWHFFGGVEYYLYILKTFLCCLSFLYVCFRCYTLNNDVLDDEHFFIIGIKPDTFQDFILSLFKRPIGGVGIYARGVLYHYHKGILKEHSKDYVLLRKPKFQIIKERRITAKRLTVLKGLKNSPYSKWSLRYNCITVLLPIVIGKGKPL